MKIENLKSFYDLMFQTRDVRRILVAAYLQEQTVPSPELKSLHEALAALETIPQEQGQYKLFLDAEQTILLDLSYEINELKKDILFLEQGEASYLEHLEHLHNQFSSQVNEGLARLKNFPLRAFITDRDGTVNNYCGRYASSIQSVYNAVFLTRFAQKCVEHAIILTSAPLDNIGLVDISVAPAGAFIYAGSKGREYFNEKNERCQFPIDPKKQHILDQLNRKLSELIKQPQYQKFSLIGSGLQYKFGQTTIARQDINGSIPQKETETFKQLILEIVQELDPDKTQFRIEDTDKDLEIILTIESKKGSGELKDFDKGDAVNFLDTDLKLQLDKGGALICGDTSSDIPMAVSAQAKNKNTFSLFVTEDDDLKEKVFQSCPNTLIVSQPDVLVTILNQFSQQ